MQLAHWIRDLGIKVQEIPPITFSGGIGLGPWGTDGMTIGGQVYHWQYGYRLDFGDEIIEICANTPAEIYRSITSLLREFRGLAPEGRSVDQRMMANGGCRH